MTPKTGKIIAVNAHTIQTRGALKILEQFLAEIKNHANPRDRYIVFVSRGVSLDYCRDNQRVEIVEVGYRFLGGKIWFCWWGMQAQLRRLGVVEGVDCVVSLSNICSRAKGKKKHRAPEFLYYHQPLPLYPHHWNPLKKSERAFFFYQNIFKWFVRWSLHKRAMVISQLKCMSLRIAKVYGVKKEQIIEITPQVRLSRDFTTPDIDKDSINLLYPASSFPYKNHRILFEALLLIKSTKVTLHLTLKQGDVPVPAEFGDNITVKFMGAISDAELYGLFSEVDALVFPSYIETFGLPMVEAGLLGVGVLAGDMDFSREVLREYQGVKFINTSSAEDWAEAIEGLERAKRYPLLTQRSEGSWGDLFGRIGDL